jgi:hypothetical protein
MTQEFLNHLLDWLAKAKVSDGIQVDTIFHAARDAKKRLQQAAFAESVDASNRNPIDVQVNPGTDK